MLILLTPQVLKASRSPSEYLLHISSGFTSTVNSSTALKSYCMERAEQIDINCSGLRMEGVPPPKYIVLIIEPFGRNILRLSDSLTKAATNASATPLLRINSE